MTKSRWRESIKSVGSHIDPEREEQLKKTKIGTYFSPKQPQFLQYYWMPKDCDINFQYLSTFTWNENFCYENTLAVSERGMYSDIPLKNMKKKGMTLFFIF